MDSVIKGQWLDDLRSGDFRQGKGTLHRVKRDDEGKIVHEFCCLGVLCEQAVAAGVADRVLEGDDDNGRYRYYAAGTHHLETGESNYLPEVVRTWAGIDTYSPRVVHPEDGTDRKIALADLNDSYDKTFADIATVIENDDRN